MQLQSVELPPLKNNIFEKQHISNAVANTDISGRLSLVNLALEMNRSASLVAAERPKVPKSAQEFFNLPDRILLHGEINEN